MVVKFLRGKLRCNRRSMVLFPVAILAIFFLPLACNVDYFGLFGSTDLDDRLESKNTFNFLTDADRNLPLGDEYSFIVLTDIHIEEGDTHGLEKLTGVLKDAAFVVITGDISQTGNREDLKKFIAIAHTLSIPCYPVIGNHDIYFDNWPAWRELIGSTSYRIDHSNTTMFILDSANASFGSTQLDWLQDELPRAKKHVFVFTHTNLFVESPINFQQLSDTRERAWILSILKGRVDTVFMGHLHKRIIREVGGGTYIAIEDFRRNGTYCRVYVSDGVTRYEFAKM